jgi:rhomboid family GlyGly-CTERM serine protease
MRWDQLRFRATQAAKMKARVPWLTLAIAAGALLVAAVPAARDLLIYDRERILAGEFWRMFTGHWVHFSARHLLMDVTAFAVIGSVIEAKRLPNFPALCALGPFLISAASFVFDSDMQRYGGLSALALGAFVFVAIHGLRGNENLRLISTAMLALAIVKILYEIRFGAALFVPSSDSTICVAVTSHIAGAIIGALFAASGFLKSVPACVSFCARAKQVRSESPDHSRQV